MGHVDANAWAEMITGEWRTGLLGHVCRGVHGLRRAGQGIREEPRRFLEDNGAGALGASHTVCVGGFALWIG